MKKKLFKISMGFIAMLFLGVIIQSCCRDKTEYKICEMSLQIDAYSGQDSLQLYNVNTQDNIDTSYNHFNYYLQGLTTPVGDMCFRSMPFINSAYAFQPCPRNIVDSIPRNNINLSFDRDITFNGNVITAGTNLMADPNLTSALRYEYYSEQIFSGQIRMDSANLALMQLDTGYYKMTLVAKTTLGHSQMFEKKVLFKR